MTCSNGDSIVMGAEDPYNLRCVISKCEGSASSLDFNDIVSATFEVRTPSGDVVEWVAQIESFLPSESITLAYLFQPGDLDELGEYQVSTKLLTSAGGNVYSNPRRFTVAPQFKD